MAKGDLRRFAVADIGEWIGDDVELVVLDGRHLTALLHWARIGIERGREAAAVIREAGARGTSSAGGGLFTLEALQEIAGGVRESVHVAEAAVAILERAERVIVPLDTAADDGEPR